MLPGDPFGTNIISSYSVEETKALAHDRKLEKQAKASTQNAQIAILAD